jgi:aspartate ammonia-lyase
VFEGGAAANIFDAMDMMRRSVETFVERCLKKIVANKKRCRELVSKSRY